MPILLNTAEKKIPKKHKENRVLSFLNQDIQLSSPKLKDKKKESFYLELGSLLESSVEIKTSIEIIEEQQSKSRDKQLFQDLKDMVVEGKSLSEAMSSFKHFSSYEVNSIRIGEESGLLPTVIKDLATFYQKKVRQKMQVMSALSYPIVVILSLIHI